MGTSKVINSRLRVREEISKALDCLTQAESTNEGKDFLTWKAYSHVELAVLIVKLEVGEDLLLSQAPEVKPPRGKGPAELLRQAEAQLAKDDLSDVLYVLRAARDLLMNEVKLARKRLAGARKLQKN